MIGFKLWLHPLHRQTCRVPLRINEMQHVSAHHERITVLREICSEASTRAVDVAELTEVIVHTEELVVRTEEVGNPLRLPLRLSQLSEYDTSESAGKRSDGVLGFVAYGYPLTEFTACWRNFGKCEPLENTQGHVWLFVVTAGASRAFASEEPSYVLNRAMNALIGRGAITGDTNGFEIANSRVGKGGFGTVHFFRRKHDHSETVYAGKLVDAAAATAACAESDYLLEVRSHPNIVAFMGTFRFVTHTHEEKWMIVMEAHLGGDVDMRVRRFGALADRDALEVSRGVLKALSHLHEYQIVHRDVKPANVVLASDGRAVLIDMGLAVHASESEKRKKPCGTPGFIAPEILLRRGCQFKSDVFGCGAVLYFLVSGMLPFAASSKEETISLNGRARVNFDDARFLKVPLHTIELIRNMVEMKPSKRPKASAARDAVTLAIEFCSPVKVQETPSTVHRQDMSKVAESSDQGSWSAWQSMSKRMRAFSSVKVSDMFSSFSIASPMNSSDNVFHGGGKQELGEKIKTDKFFSKAREILGVRQTKRPVH